MSRESRAISRVFDIHSLTATDGDINSRSSRAEIPSFSGAPSLTILHMSFSSFAVNGKISSVDRTLNAVCAAAMPTGLIADEKNGPPTVMRSISNRVKNTAVPITFTDVCAAATRFAFLLPPMQDISAVMQVPMF